MSNLETLLTAWLNDGEVPAGFRPETRIEEYLVAILEGVDDSVTPESRADVLLDAIATKYAGYADGITDLRAKLGLDTVPEFDEATTPQLIALAQDLINGFALGDLAEKGATGVARNTLAILDAYSNLPSGGAELNIAFDSTTAPEDTTKLWVKTAQPQNVTVDYDINNGVESVQALTAVLPMATNRVGVGAVGTKVYLFATDDSGVVRVYDTETDAILNTNQVHGMTYSAYGVVDEKIYIFGGERYGPQNTIKVFDTTTNAISTLSVTLPQPVYHLACGVVGTRCYLFGGYGGQGNYSEQNTIYVYDTEAGTLTRLTATLPTAAKQISVAVVGTKIYLFGGRNGDTTLLDTINVFDTVTNTISTLPVTFHTPYAQMSAVTFGTKCYLLGGLIPSGGVRVSVDTITVFDVETETLTTSSNTLPQPLYSMGVGMVVNDAYLFGGASTQLGNVAVDSINKFTVTFPLNEGDVYLQEDVFKNKFSLMTAPTEVKTGVSAVYVGNAQNEAEYAEARLYNSTSQTWELIT